MTWLVWRQYRGQTAVAAALLAAFAAVLVVTGLRIAAQWHSAVTATQSVTRRHWLAVKAEWLLLAAALWGGAVGALVTWWSGPRNALYQNQFQPGSVPQSSNGLVLGTVNGGIPVSSLPGPCQALATVAGRTFTRTSQHAVLSCAQAHHIRAYVTYQPASRYWVFQGIETGIFVLLAAALLAVAFVVINRRDA